MVYSILFSFILTNKHKINNNRGDEECVEEIVREATSNNEDEREEAELKLMEQRDMEQSESQEQKDYKTEFFELLDEVSWKSALVHSS